jgi:hypothetical protein
VIVLIRIRALAALVLVTACGDGTGDASGPDGLGGERATLEPPGTAPDIRGAITRVIPGDSVVRHGDTQNPNGNASCPPSCVTVGTPMRSVLVEETPGASAGGDKSVMRVPRDARLYRRVGGALVRIGFDDLRTGQRVEAWFDGPVAESYPTQTTAGVIVVLE